MKLLDILKEIKVKGTGPTGRRVRDYTILHFSPDNESATDWITQSDSPRQAILNYLSKNYLSNLTSHPKTIAQYMERWDSLPTFLIRVHGTIYEFKKLFAGDYLGTLPGVVPRDILNIIMDRVSESDYSETLDEIKIKPLGTTGRRPFVFTNFKPIIGLTKVETEFFRADYYLELVDLGSYYTFVPYQGQPHVVLIPKSYVERTDKTGDVSEDYLRQAMPNIINLIKSKQITLVEPLTEIQVKLGNKTGRKPSQPYSVIVYDNIGNEAMTYTDYRATGSSNRQALINYFQTQYEHLTLPEIVDSVEEMERKERHRKYPDNIEMWQSVDDFEIYITVPGELSSLELDRVLHKVFSNW